MGNWRSDLRVKAGTFDRDGSAATGNVSITGVGFKPRALIVFMAGMSNFVESSFGLSDGSSEGSVVANAGVSVGITDVLINFDDASAGTNLQRATVSSFDEDGFTLAWTKTGTPGAETLRCYYLALG